MITVLQSSHYERWRAGLKDVRARALIAARVDRMRYGHLGDVKKVGGGILELRIHYGPGYRIYLQRRGDSIVLLLCGGDKSTQARDIEKAKQLAKEWSEKDG